MNRVRSLKNTKSKKVFHFKPVTDAQINAAFDRLEKNVRIRATRKLLQKAKESGKSLAGLNERFNDTDARFLVVESWADELSGVPMPPSIDSDLGFSLKKALFPEKKIVDKVAKQVGKAVKKVFMKIGPVVIGAIVSFYAGPVVGKAVAAAMSKVASTYAAKRIQAIEYNRMLKEAKEKAAKMGVSYKTTELPLGLTQADAAIVLNNKIPEGKNEEWVWHIIEQAKLIGDNNISPEDAYVMHYHTYGKDAPPISYVGDPDPKLVDQLNALVDTIYDKLKVGGIRWSVATNQTDDLIKAFNILKTGISSALNKYTTADASEPEKRKEMNLLRKINVAIKETEPLISKYKTLSNEVEASKKKYFAGAKYVGEGATAIDPSATQETKQIAVKALLDPSMTEKVTDAAKEVLKSKGIDIQSTAGKEALQLQIKQLQQQVATAIAEGKQIVTATTAPEITSTKTSEGTQVTVTEPKSNIGALLFPAAAILLALKGA